MSAKDTFTTVVSRMLFRGARILLSTAVALIAVGVFLGVSLFVAFSTMKEGIHTPHIMNAFITGAAAILGHVTSHFTAYFGLYLSFLGLFSSGYEIVAKAHKIDYEQSLSEGLTTSAKSIWTTLAVGGASAFVVAFVVSCLGNNRIASRIWVHEKGLQIIESEGWVAYLKQAATFEGESRIMLGLYLFATIGLITVAVAAVRAVWSVGFWGLLRSLIAVSSYLSRVFKVEGASAPIASILMTLIGMLITLL